MVLPLEEPNPILLLEPGHHVDIIAVFDGDRGVRTLVRDVVVLAVGQTILPPEERASQALDPEREVGGPRPFSPQEAARQRQAEREALVAAQQRRPPNQRSAPADLTASLTVAVLPEEAEMLALAKRNGFLVYTIRSKR